SFLISRTDSSLDTAHVSAESALHGPGGGGPHGGGDHRPAPSSGFDGSPDIGRITASVPGVFVQVRRPSGDIVATGGAPRFPGTQEASPPRLPQTIDLSQSNGPDRVSYFTAPASDGSDRYRVRASSV